MSDFNTGVDETQVAAENTGVDGAQAAAVDGSEESFDENTLFVEDEAVPEDISLEELLSEGDSETVVNTGDDNPTGAQSDSNTQTEKNETAPSPTQQSVDTSKAFALRLQQETAKIEARIRKEFEQKQASSLEERIEGRAHKLMADYPDDIKSLEYARKVARNDLLSESSAQQPNTQQTAQTDDADRVQAWKEKLISEEPMLKLATGDPNITVRSYMDKDPIFRKALSLGNSPMEAHEITKIVRGEMQREVDAAKAAAGQEVINQMKSSNARATAPVSNVKNTGQRIKSIADMTADEIEAAMEKAERQGKRLRID
jgi:hypothetical protein